MSYILDALRRADAERRRGQSPVLADVAVLSAAGDRSAAPSIWRRMTPWVALALLAGGGALAWWISSAGPAPAPVAATPKPPPAMVTRPVPPPMNVPPPQAQTQLPQVAAPQAAAPVAPQPVVQPPATPPVAATGLPPAVPPQSAAVRVPTPPPTAVVTAAAARPIPLASLPEPQRSAVTRLAFGGAVHSADRSQSFVLLAGQIVREGETLAPGIVLEQIAPRQLVLRVGEQRVEVPQ